MIFHNCKIFHNPIKIPVLLVFHLAFKANGTKILLVIIASFLSTFYIGIGVIMAIFHWDGSILLSNNVCNNLCKCLKMYGFLSISFGISSFQLVYLNTHFVFHFAFYFFFEVNNVNFKHIIKT